jgi:hypothetical protein
MRDLACSFLSGDLFISVACIEKIIKIYDNSPMSPIVTLLILAMPIASVAWTITHEEIFREPREALEKRRDTATSMLGYKFFYMLTCEYCLSHYITILLLIFTKYTLFFSDWRGYVLSGFSLVWIANIYMSLYRLVRLDIKLVAKESNKN